MNPKTGKAEKLFLEKDIGALALRKDGGAVMALGDGFYFFDFETGKSDWYAREEYHE